MTAPQVEMIYRSLKGYWKPAGYWTYGSWTILYWGREIVSAVYGKTIVLWDGKIQNEEEIKGLQFTSIGY